MIDLTQKKHIHFVGIKGAGMAALAVVAKERGFTVTGSDVDEKFVTDPILDRAGIEVSSGFSKDHVHVLLSTKHELLVITTGAHNGLHNEEAVYAKEEGVDVISYGEALGLFMSGKQGISVAGSHGKTTTSAMIAHILTAVKVDPSYVVGCGGITSLHASGHWGKGSYFIAEADEYVSDPQVDATPKFLYQHPDIAVITNIDFDHPDVFSSLNQIQDIFVQFLSGVTPYGTVIACVDDTPLRSILPLVKRTIITYGFATAADCQIRSVVTANNTSSFQLILNKHDLGTFTLHVPGRQNILNATAAILAAHTADVPIDVIKDALTSFSGTKRRFEFIGITAKGARLYDDYAHHPTEIEATIKASRDWFPGARIICLFQPHTYSRTKALMKDFAHALSSFDAACVMEIFPSAREQVDSTVNSAQLVTQISLKNKSVWYTPDRNDVLVKLKEIVHEDDIIFTIGAGDVYKLGEAILRL